MMEDIKTCPYCGSTDIIAGLFEMYCQDCGESWYDSEINEE